MSLWEVLKERKKWWLAPLALVLAAAAAILILSALSPDAPFVYPLR